MEEAYMGVIVPWAVPYAPMNWMLCQGQSLPINQYSALYALLGTTYGGTATTFNLPNLCGQIPIGSGVDSSTGIAYQQGKVYGANMVQITANNLPVHTHNITNNAVVTGGTTGSTSVDVNIPVNTEAYDATTAKNSPDNTCTLGQGKTNNNVVTNIYTTKAPTSGANLKPFTATGTVSVQAPTVQVISTCQANATPNTAISVMQKSLCLNYIICVAGYFPVRP